MQKYPDLDIHIAHSEEDSAYVARVAQMPGLATHGVTPESALLELSEVIELRADELEALRSSIEETKKSYRHYTVNKDRKSGKTMSVVWENHEPSLSEIQDATREEFPGINPANINIIGTEDDGVPYLHLSHCLICH